MKLRRMLLPFAMASALTFTVAATSGAEPPASPAGSLPTGQHYVDKEFQTTLSGAPQPQAGKQYAYVHANQSAVSPFSTNKPAPPVPIIPSAPDPSLIAQCVDPANASKAQTPTGWTIDRYRWCEAANENWDRFILQPDGSEELVGHLQMRVVWTGYADPASRQFVVYSVADQLDIPLGEDLYHDSDLFLIGMVCAPSSGTASCSIQQTPANAPTLAQIRDDAPVTVKNVITDTSQQNFPLTGDQVAPFNLNHSWEGRPGDGSGSGVVVLGQPFGARCDSSSGLRFGNGCVFTDALLILVYDMSDTAFPITAVGTHIRDAQAAGAPGRVTNGVPDGPPLTRLRNPDAQKANRRKATAKNCQGTSPPPPRTTECDEYPFASTNEGANNTTGGVTSARAIPATVNHEGGNQLANFYALYRLLNGDRFWVQVIN